MSLTDLHRLAFDSSVTDAQPWAHQLERHSLTWIGAFTGRTPAGDVAPAVRVHIRAVGDAQLWTQARGGLSTTASNRRRTTVNPSAWRVVNDGQNASAGQRR